MRTWEPEQSCDALHCTDDVNSQRDVLACVAYPPSQFPRKVAFGGGAFYILLLGEKVTDYECLAGDPSWSTWERVDETLDGHPAVRFQGGGAWTSHSLRAEHYAVFVKNRCFHLGIRRSYVSTGPFDPGTYEEFTKQDDELVDQKLHEVLHSLHFKM